MRAALQMMGAVAVAGPLVFAMIRLGLLPGLDEANTAAFWVSIAAVYYGVPTMAVLVLALGRGEPLGRSLGLRGTSVGWLLGGSTAGAFVALAFNALFSASVTLAGLEPPEVSTKVVDLLSYDLRQDSLGAAVSLALVVLAAPFIEEVVFRGVVLSGLLRRLGPVPGIAVTAFVFAAVHLDLWHFVPLAFLGLVLSYLAWGSRSVWPAFIAHALVNGLAYVMTALNGVSG